MDGNSRVDYLFLENAQRNYIQKGSDNQTEEEPLPYQKLNLAYPKLLGSVYLSKPNKGQREKKN